MSETPSGEEQQSEYAELDGWEIHLVYNRSYESPSDESLAIAAPDRETAISEARRVSKNNPPELGPVYNEGDMIPPQMCDNWPSVQESTDL